MVYPIPCEGLANIICPEIYSEYEVRTIHGKLVTNGNINSQSFSIDLRDCETGIYLLFLKGQNKVFVKRVSIIMI